MQKISRVLHLLTTSEYHLAKWGT